VITVKEASAVIPLSWFVAPDNVLHPNNHSDVTVVISLIIVPIDSTLIIELEFGFGESLIVIITVKTLNYYNLILKKTNSVI
jgi:hypothetical protein